MKQTRIYIMGSMGSGKSSLAKELSERLKIKSYDLDDVVWIKKFTKKRDKGNRIKLFNKIVDKKRWIIEGVYISWTEIIFKKADLVVLLDPSVIKLKWRIFLRYLKSRKLGQNESLKGTFALMKYAGSYKKGDHSSSYKSQISMINKHKVKYIILRNKKEINKFIEGLG